MARVSTTYVFSFCRQWRIAEFSLCNTERPGAFGAYSHIDVLIRFSKDARWTFRDIVRMQEGLNQIYGYKVDITIARPDDALPKDETPPE